MAFQARVLDLEERWGKTNWQQCVPLDLRRHYLRTVNAGQQEARYMSEGRLGLEKTKPSIVAISYNAYHESSSTSGRAVHHNNDVL